MNVDCVPSPRLQPCCPVSVSAVAAGFRDVAVCAVLFALALALKGKKMLQVFANGIPGAVKQLAGALVLKYEYPKRIQSGFLHRNRVLSLIVPFIFYRMGLLIFLMANAAYAEDKAWKDHVVFDKGNLSVDVSGVLVGKLLKEIGLKAKVNVPVGAAQYIGLPGK